MKLVDDESFLILPEVIDVVVVVVAVVVDVVVVVIVVLVGDFLVVL